MLKFWYNSLFHEYFHFIFIFFIYGKSSLKNTREVIGSTSTVGFEVDKTVEINRILKR
jgi:hypothetical protein